MFKINFCRASIVAAGFAAGVIGAQSASADFLKDSKASINSRTLYLEADNREQDADQRQTATGLKFDYLSGYTEGTLGVGLDLQGIMGINLGGGIDNHGTSTANNFTPVDTDGTPVAEWSSLRGAVKIKLSKTEAKAGNALAPNLPILVSNDGRLLPASYQGAMVTSKDIDNVVITAGRLNREIARASSNWAGIAANGGTHGSNGFWFGGADWKVRNNLTLQYYYATLEDYYRQNFFGLIHTWQMTPNQSFKTDLRYFNSRSDGRNGNSGYLFNNNGGFAKHAGEVNNDTWSAFFTYTLAGHAFLLGHQQVGDDGGMVVVNNGSVADGRGRPEGEIGTSYYLFTDSMANPFVRAGENTTFGQYSFDFASIGVPGLKAAVAYLHATGIKDAKGLNETYREWERDLRVDYVIQSGPAKGLGFTLRRANYRTGVPDGQGGYDIDQTRLYLNYTYTFM
ncbi:OprD family outer membrane porin [Pseudomonas agarici]|uniref:OprD family outer membrane porin n=1 Tax=Pseudomonas agarici TaxID=46677 RepID=UPI000AB2CB52